MRDGANRSRANGLTFNTFPSLSLTIGFEHPTNGKCLFRDSRVATPLDNTIARCYLHPLSISTTHGVNSVRVETRA